MNAISLNNLLAYLQSLNLTASNREWLFEHLHDTRKEETHKSSSTSKTITGNQILAEDELPEVVRNLIGVAAEVEDDDINGRNAYYSHLERKYA